MEQQATIGEPSIQDPAQRQGLALTAAVADDIVGVPLKWHTGKYPPYPDVLPKQEIPGVGSVAYCADPEGTVFGVFQPAQR